MFSSLLRRSPSFSLPFPLSTQISSRSSYSLSLALSHSLPFSSSQNIFRPSVLLPHSNIPTFSSSFSSSSSSSSQSKGNGNVVVKSPLAPSAIGPYSQAIKSNGFVFVSGSLGLDPSTGDFPSPIDISSQTKQSMENIKNILLSADSDMNQIVKTTILLSDMKDFPIVNTIYSSYFTGNFPARATYAVKGLPKGALVEIEAIATHK